MNVLELHARGRQRWNGDEWWEPDDFVWRVDWNADKVTTKINRTKHPDVYATLQSVDVLNKKDMHKIEDWHKIVNSRNPFTRLYSAWNDKSRSFPKYPNGSIMYYGMDLNKTFKNKFRVHKSVSINSIMKFLCELHNRKKFQA